MFDAAQAADASFGPKDDEIVQRRAFRQLQHSSNPWGEPTDPTAPLKPGPEVTPAECPTHGKDPIASHGGTVEWHFGRSSRPEESGGGEDGT